MQSSAPTVRLLDQANILWQSIPPESALITPDAKSGAGYFYDDVLEYRVWFNPANGAEPLNGEKDYFVAFAQYEAADAFAKKTPGAEGPLVLVRQLEWISEPERGHFIPEKGERITEWQTVWLRNNKRTDESIREFMKHPREAARDGDPWYVLILWSQPSLFWMLLAAVPSAEIPRWSCQ